MRNAKSLGLALVVILIIVAAVPFRLPRRMTQISYSIRVSKILKILIRRLAKITRLTLRIAASMTRFSSIAAAKWNRI